MSKDYAKKKSAPGKNSRGASRTKNKQYVSPLLIVVTVVLLSGLVAGLVYLKWFAASSDQTNQTSALPPLPVEQSAKSQKEGKKSEGNANSLPKNEEIPLYELHQDLINKEVVIPADQLKLPDDSTKFYYTMPCGSFRENYRAEELKAQIAMTGNNSSIESVMSKGETWYRVKLGPFNRKRQAEKIRHRLQDNDIQGCIILEHKLASAR